MVPDQYLAQLLCMYIISIQEYRMAIQSHSNIQCVRIHVRFTGPSFLSVWRFQYYLKGDPIAVCFNADMYRLVIWSYNIYYNMPKIQLSTLLKKL